MSDYAVSVRGVAKKYRIRHQREGRRYLALRDVISASARSVGSSVMGWARAGGRRARFGNGGAREPFAQAEDFWALQDISFDVPPGGVVGIIGRNGAGKSTLLKILSRITEPTKGQIRIRGRVASLLEVGTGFHPELTGRENIYLNGAILGMKQAEIRKKFDEIVAFADIEKFLDTPVKHYSSGMYVRAAFAVAAHLEPDILIVDEVLAVGDAEFQKKCTGKMRSVAAREGRTVLFVSHQLGLVRDLCEEAILIDNGRLKERGPSSVVVDKYLSQSITTHQQTIRSRYVLSVAPAAGMSSGDWFFGEPLALEISLHDLPDAPAGVEVLIRNAEGRLICQFATNPHDGFALPRRAAMTVVFRLDPCTLVPGEYFLDLAITEPAIKILEIVQGVFGFAVHPRAVGGTWTYDSRNGDVLPPHQWDVLGD
ncbi:MAG: ABC transporter ATP-binding protein [Vicinamibacterales bacterium]